MRYAADLHLHSRHAKAVSSNMTLENIAATARRKGVDVLATGDCLQEEWLKELEDGLLPAEPGWFALKSEGKTPFPGSLRFVLSTEVHCAPSGSRELEGLHHLVYFPSFEAVRALRSQLQRLGEDLREGRPRLRISSWELLQIVLESGADCHFAPAHVLNPYFSALGSVMKQRRLEEIFGDSASHLLAVEMGLTSIPPMCRRISSLDGHALFASSDAHSLENIGRECTLLETEPGYAPLFAALRRGSRDEVIACLKYSIFRARYFRNWCGRCQEHYDGTHCPQAHGPLVTGSREWLEEIADRPEPAAVPGTPRFRMYVPLRELLSEFLNVGPSSRKVAQLQSQLLRTVGHERDILTRIPFEEIAAASSDSLAHAIVAQRSPDYRQPNVISPPAVQTELF
jgi:DNA helicase-2/ATP-dependent DNA helicase PcrA